MLFSMGVVDTENSGTLLLFLQVQGDGKFRGGYLTILVSFTGGLLFNYVGDPSSIGRPDRLCLEFILLGTLDTGGGLARVESV